MAGGTFLEKTVCPFDPGCEESLELSKLKPYKYRVYPRVRGLVVTLWLG